MLVTDCHCETKQSSSKHQMKVTVPQSGKNCSPSDNFEISWVQTTNVTHLSYLSDYIVCRQNLIHEKPRENKKINPLLLLDQTVQHYLIRICRNGIKVFIEL